MVNMRVILFFIFLLACSCNNGGKKMHHHTFLNNTWHTDSVLAFDFLLKDSTVFHSFEIEIRHDVDYAFQNLFFFIINDSKIDTVDLQICEKDGKWKGKGIGSVRTILYKFEEGFLFQTSNPKIKVEQAMRYGHLNKIEKLKSMLSFGLSIKPSHE
tara:strand:+ start:3001 stop:3468 length:468 start_codon:yes stop_codon:yes gene_type:complete